MGNKNDIYLNLYHGRDSVDEILHDWGLDGPIIGPLTSFQVTYMFHIKLDHEDETTGEWTRLDLFSNKHDLIEFQGKFYGDFCIQTEVSEEQKKRVISLEKLKELENLGKVVEIF
jgi:hypothetical protein